jgi:hypothetical protein
MKFDGMKFGARGLKARFHVNQTKSTLIVLMDSSFEGEKG